MDPHLNPVNIKVSILRQFVSLNNQHHRIGYLIKGYVCRIQEEAQSEQDHAVAVMNLQCKVSEFIAHGDRNDNIICNKCDSWTDKCPPP